MIERRRLLAALAGIALVLSAPVLSWHHVGDLSVRGYDQLDYAQTPPHFSAATAHAWVLGAWIAAVLAVLVLALGLLRRWGRRRWAFVVVPLTAVGLLFGYLGRVMTAGVVGANIGAGLAVMFFGPVMLVLLAVATWQGAVLLRSRRPRAV